MDIVKSQEYKQRAFCIVGGGGGACMGDRTLDPLSNAAMSWLSQEP